MDPFKEFDYKGYKVALIQDEDPDGPDSWGNTDRFLVYDHRDFEVNVKGFDANEIFEVWQSGKSMFSGYCIFPVLAYIHSGVILSLSRNSYPFTDPWDTSFKGFALVKRQKGDGTKEKARKSAQGLIETWNTYLSGDVVGFTIEDQEGKHIDSCWGFYSSDYCEESAKESIDSIVTDKIQSHFTQLKTWIKNRVPFLYRKPIAELWEGSLPIMN